MTAPEKNNNSGSPWYKKWWGIVLSVLFFPFVVPYLVWTKTTWHKGVKIAITVFCILFVIGNIENDTQQKPLKRQAPIQTQEQAIIEKERVQIDPIAYEILETEDLSLKALGNKLLSSYTTQEIGSLPIDKRISYRILVSPEIKEKEVRPTVKKIISDVTSKDDDIDEISLLLYSDKELAGGMYDVAMVTWAPNGKRGNVSPEIARSNDRSTYQTSISIKEDLEDYLKQRGLSEDKFGLSEEKRKEIFKELVSVERRATKEADAKYPLDNPNITMEDIQNNGGLMNELMEKYSKQVQEKYGITEDQDTKITVEAIMENWPL